MSSLDVLKPKKHRLANGLNRSSETDADDELNVFLWIQNLAENLDCLKIMGLNDL